MSDEIDQRMNEIELLANHPYLKNRPWIVECRGGWEVRWRDFLSVRQERFCSSQADAARVAAEIEARQRFIPLELLHDACITFEEAERFWIDKMEGHSVYGHYLAAPHWQEVRRAALERAEYRCQVCNREDARLEVHHRTYDRLGCERPQDVTVLCSDCHTLFHDKIKLERPT